MNIVFFCNVMEVKLHPVIWVGCWVIVTHSNFPSVILSISQSVDWCEVNNSASQLTCQSLMKLVDQSVCQSFSRINGQTHNINTQTSMGKLSEF